MKTKTYNLKHKDGTLSKVKGALLRFPEQSLHETKGASSAEKVKKVTTRLWGTTKNVTGIQSVVLSFVYFIIGWIASGSPIGGLVFVGFHAILSFIACTFWIPGLNIILLIYFIPISIELATTLSICGIFAWFITILDLIVFGFLTAWMMFVYAVLLIGMIKASKIE